MSNRFRTTYRPLTKDEVQLVGMFKGYAERMDELICRCYQERGIQHDQLNSARERLEESVMWFTKGVTG